MVVAREDGGRGWKVLGLLQYLAECSEFLHAQGPRAWAVDPETGMLPDDPLSQRIREYISRDGIKVEKKWYYPSPGDEIHINVSDTAKNVFRQENPRCPGTLLVQTDTPLRFINVVLKVYVSLSTYDVEIKEEGGGFAGDAPPAAAAAPAPVLVPTLGGADGAIMPAAAGGLKKKATRTERRLIEYPRYECPTAEISDEYDASKALSERKHETQNPHVHNMVPIEVIRAGDVRPPQNAYFYVKNVMQTPFTDDSAADMVGVTLMRYTDKDTRDFKSEFDNVVKPDSRIRFNVYQWRGRPSRDERYIVSIQTGKDSPEYWRAYGITALEPYERIIGANPELGLHVHAELWWGKTMKHLPNGPTELGNTPFNIAQKTENVRGYYFYGMKELVPDHLRFFRSGGAIRLSAERVSNEFSYWESVNKKTGKSDCKLNALPGPANPVNTLGLASPVLSLGNGQRASEDSDVGIYVAYPGVNIMPLFQGGQHDFFAMTSHVLTKEERSQYCSVLNTSVMADKFLDDLIERDSIHYWIYAVRRDAKMAGQMVRNVAPPAKPLPIPPPGPAVSVGEKRPREDDETRGNGPVGHAKVEEVEEFIQ